MWSIGIKIKFTFFCCSIAFSYLIISLNMVIVMVSIYNNSAPCREECSSFILADDGLKDLSKTLL